MEEILIKVYIKVNQNNEVIEVNSDIFIDDFTNWIYIDEGMGDRYAHAQNQYFAKPLLDENDRYNYAYRGGRIVEN